MKKSTWPFLLFFFILLGFHAFAGTTTLTTYYPSPTAAYTQVKLSTNYAASNNTATVFCTGSNNGAIFINSSKVLYTCTAAGAATQYCTALNNGVLISDNTGTLHVCSNNGQDSIYPQECYNSFCTYDASNSGTACASYTGGVMNAQGACPAGFTQQPINGSGAMYDQFQTSTNTRVVSIVCCSA